MTTLFGPYESAMDLPHVDDKMELGTSPYPHVDDIDFDFEPDRQTSIDRSMADDMENTGNTIDLMHADGEDLFKDDDMLDEEENDTTQQSHDNAKEDLNMDFYDGENINDLDEEIIYDEEGRSFDMNEHQEDQLNNGDFLETENVHDDVNTQVKQETLTEKHVENLDPSNTNPTPEHSQPIENVGNEPENDSSANDNPTHIDNHAAAQTEIVDFAIQESAVQQTGSLTDDIANSTILQNDQEHTAQTVHNKTVDEAEENELSASTIAEATSTHQVISEPTLENIENHESKDDDHESDEVTGSLHPVTVVYLGQEMSFFPPMADDTSATFFLSDSNLAYEPVERLLASCRDILGDTLEHDDELVLDIPALGLHICEDSKYASQITLSQIVDIYLVLSRNENRDNIDPLYCSLSSRVCLASQYAYLAASASEGKTFTEIAADYVDSPELPEDVDNSQIDVTQDSTNAMNEREDVPEAETTHNVQDESAVQEDEEATVDYMTNSIATGVPETIEKTSLQPMGGAQVDVGGFNDEESHEGTAETLSQHKDLPETGIRAEYEITNEADQIQEQDVENAPYAEAEDEENASVSSHTVEEEVAAESSENLLPSSENIESHEDNTQQVDQNSHEEFDVFHPSGELIEENNQNADESIRFDQDVDRVVNGDTHDSISSTLKDDINYDDLEFDENVDPFESKDEIENPDDLDELNTEDAKAVTPVTPSKQNASKRKAVDDDDELDLLDLSTPEPKRSRAS